MRVENMKSPRGNTVPNQFIITTSRGRLFQSYNSPIAFMSYDGTVTLSNDWDYSHTTSKYRNIFLGETTDDTRKKIETGEYRMNLEELLRCYS